MLSLTAAVMATHAAATGSGYGDADDNTPPVATRPQAHDATAVIPAPAATTPATPPSPVSSTCGVSESFEGPDPLAAWELDVNDSGPAPPIAVFCAGDLDSAPVDYGTDDYDYTRGRTSTFTDVVDVAADGSCALRVVAGCAAGPGTSNNIPTTNTASRTFVVANVGCGGGATGFTLSVAVTFDVKADGFTADYVPPNGLLPVLLGGSDRAAVTATVGRGGPEIDVVTLSVAKSVNPFEDDGGVTRGFVVFTADLGDVPEGSSVEVAVAVSATNDQDCVLDTGQFDSVIVIDDIRIEPRL